MKLPSFIRNRVIREFEPALINAMSSSEMRAQHLLYRRASLATRPALAPRLESRRPPRARPDGASAEGLAPWIAPASVSSRSAASIQALSPSIADRCRRTGRLVHPFGEPQVVVESRDSRADIRDRVYALRFEA